MSFPASQASGNKSSNKMAKSSNLSQLLRDAAASIRPTIAATNRPANLDLTKGQPSSQQSGEAASKPPSATLPKIPAAVPERPGTVGELYIAPTARDHPSPPLSAGPTSQVGDKSSDLLLSRTKSTPAAKPPRDPRAGRTNVIDALMDTNRQAPVPASVNPYASTSSRPAPVATTTQQSANTSSSLKDEFSTYLKRQEQIQAADSQIVIEQSAAVSPTAVVENGGDGFVSVLKKIGLDEGAMQTIMHLTERNKNKVKPKEAEQPSERSDDVLSWLDKLDLKSYLSSASPNQPFDLNNIKAATFKLIGEMPLAVQEELVSQKDKLDAFQRRVYEIVKSSVATETPIPPTSDSDLVGLVANKVLKERKHEALLKEDERLSVGQHQMIKTFLKKDKLLESNHLISANLAVQQEVKEFMTTLQDELTHLRECIGAKASEVSSDAVDAAVESRKQLDLEFLNSTTCSYVDSGEHWCQCCDKLFDDLPSYLKHLSTPAHIALGGFEKFPSLNTEIDADFEAHLKKLQSAPPNSVAQKSVRGVEFVVPVTDTFYCLLCHQFANGQEATERHLKSQSHYTQLADFELGRPFFEKTTLLNKAVSHFSKTGQFLKSFCTWRNIPESEIPKPDPKTHHSTRRTRSRSPSSHRRRSRSRSRTRYRRSRSRSGSRSGLSKRHRSRSRSPANRDRAASVSSGSSSFKSAKSVDDRNLPPPLLGK